MKRCLIIVLAASMLVAFVGVARAEHGMPSQATLRAMGLSGMQVMSDREAMNVRGMGYYSSRKSSRKKSTAIAFGISYAKVGGHYGASAGTIDGFFAKGKHYAAGKHGSKAGKVVIIYGDGGHRGSPKGPPKGPPKKTYTKGNGKGDRPQGPPHKGGGKGGGKKVKSIVVFAGGFAIAKAY